LYGKEKVREEVRGDERPKIGYGKRGDKAVWGN